MSDSELIGRVRNSMRRQCQERGYAAPVDTLIEIEALPEKKHLAWRYGQVPYLEKACMLNLRELNVVLKEMSSYAAFKGWKPSWCCYSVGREEEVRTQKTRRAPALQQERRPLHGEALLHPLRRPRAHRRAEGAEGE